MPIQLPHLIATIGRGDAKRKANYMAMLLILERALNILKTYVQQQLAAPV